MLLHHEAARVTAMGGLHVSVCDRMFPWVARATGLEMALGKGSWVSAAAI